MADSKASLNLVVIRVKDLLAARDFYESLGLEFRSEQHNNGPEHFAADLGGLVFEIYPLEKSPATTGTRLGFRVTAIEARLDDVERHGGKIAVPLSDSPWGPRAVVLDPDGHRIELTQTVAS